MSQLTITAEQAREIVYEDNEDWVKLYNTEEITGKSRWSVHVQCVFKHTPSNKFYLFKWSRGATEYQEEKPYEYEKEVSVDEVVEKEVIVKQWTIV